MCQRAFSSDELFGFRLIKQAIHIGGEVHFHRNSQLGNQVLAVALFERGNHQRYFLNEVGNQGTQDRPIQHYFNGINIGDGQWAYFNDLVFGNGLSKEPAV